MNSSARAPSGISPSAPARPAPTERARPAWMASMGLPLTGLHVARLARLQHLVGPERFGGWCIDASGEFRVDIAGTSGFYGETLHRTIGAAMRAAGGAR